MIYLVWGDDVDPMEWSTHEDEDWAKKVAQAHKRSLLPFDDPRSCRKWVLKKLEEKKNHIGRVMEKWYKCDWMDIRSQETTAEQCSKETTTT